MCTKWGCLTANLSVVCGVMSKWEPEEYDEDPTVNALLNIAHGLHRLADATNGLLYGLKYSKGEGMSIAESIESSAKHIVEGAQAVAEAVRERG